METLQNNGNVSELVLAALRKIMRSIDLHSKFLVKRFGLTSPQLIVLREVNTHGQVTAGEVAHAVSLSQATITGIFERLEKRGLITRQRSCDDRRRILVKPTPEATKRLAGEPPLMQESFVDAFDKLEDWEKTMILSSLQRLVSLMDAQCIDAVTLLAAEALEAPKNNPPLETTNLKP
ncbi:MAG: MarR family transcriptional regulator [Desulfobacterales bacterium]|nr:MarR family transcriptional regulator [Desulfobacterales bacterium]